MAMFHQRQSATIDWLYGSLRYVFGPRGFRAIPVIVSLYIGFYALFEASHERQMNRATFERAMFVDMVSSNNRGQFVAAMKDFGRVQTITAKVEPSFLYPVNWFTSDMPNYTSLYTWARYTLSECTAQECGIVCELDCDDDRSKYRIDLYGADLRETGLCYVDLSYSRLSRAKMSKADLRFSDLTGSDLRDANMQGAVLKNAKLYGAIFGTVLENAPFSTDLSNADLHHADLRAAKGLHCDDLRSANHWEKSCRDNQLLCGGRRMERDAACNIQADLTSCYGFDANPMKYLHAKDKHFQMQ